MIARAIEEKIREYPISNVLQQENILQELIQQYILASLSRGGLFSRAQAIFHGGTCLRIIHGMNRFSEDLDFFLKRPDTEFQWKPFLVQILRDGVGEGLHFTILENLKERGAVRKVFLRTDSLGKDPSLSLPFERDRRKLIRVKLEIDTDPPPGSAVETRFISFPMTAAVTVQTLESGFGMKVGALLCRGYTKGRDWYDFIWYVGRRVVPNLGLLRNALAQQGPWAGQALTVDSEWVIRNLKDKITGIDWAEARRDVQRFLPLREQETLQLWDRDFFLHLLGLLEKYLAG